MADIAFFTNPDILNSQLSSQAYGTAGTSTSGGVTYDQYRITSYHSSSATTCKAYAITEGVICIQEDYGNSNLVNIILKPFQNPALNFVPVRYYIYKGVKKSSLINGNEVAARTLNDLTDSIWTSQDAYNASVDKLANNSPGTTVDTPNVKALGVQYKKYTSPYPPEHIDDADSIDKIFALADADFQLPTVKKDWYIGEFDPGGFGLEIIVQDLRFYPKASLARNQVNYVKVAQLGTSPTQAEQFLQSYQKEEILQFMDPCAFFGSFYNRETNWFDSSSNKTKISSDDVYNVLLKGTTHTGGNGNFYNRNTCYIDIRNEFRYSVNLFGNLSNNVSISFDQSTYAAKNYYSNGWPLLTIDNSLLPSGNTSNKNIVFIRLPIGDFTEAIANYIQGYRNINYPNDLNVETIFADLADFDSQYKTHLDVVLSNNSSASATELISSYIQILYLPLIYNEAISETQVQLRNNSFLESSLPIRSILINSEDQQSSLYVNSIEILCNQFPYTHQIFMANSCFAKQTNKNILFTIASSKYISINQTLKSNSSLVSKNFFETNFYDHLSTSLNMDYVHFPITIASSTQFIPFFIKQPLDTELQTGTPEDLFAISLSDTELLSIENAINTSFIAELDVWLTFDLVDKYADDYGVYVNEFELILNGYTLNSGGTQIMQSSLSTSINKLLLLSPNTLDSSSLIKI